jgi:hypothetical protein
MKILIVLVCVALLGCAVEWDKLPDSFKSNSIGYLQDYRTGLCFAYATSPVHGGDVVSITEVPCNGKVLNLTQFPTESRN